MARWPGWLRWFRSAPPRPAERVVGSAVTARHTAGRRISYLPSRNGRADPGEVVWVKVILEEDPFAGKDRPVLVVGRKDQRTVYALLLSSQAHRQGKPHWLSLGVGGWDAQRRPSWVRLDRVLELHDRSIRRESVALDPEVFAQVSNQLRGRYGWL
jgi:hypothetical protein